RVRSANYVSVMLHGVFAFERGDDHGTPGHERAELVEERALAVDGVETLRNGPGPRGFLEGDHAEPLLEEALKNRSLRLLFDGVGLHDAKGAFFRHFDDS